MDTPKVTPKDFFLWFGTMLTFYWSVIAFIFLLFNYIDYAFPNVLAYVPDPYMGGMPYEMASLIVLVPVYIALALIIRRGIALDPSKKDIWVRRWAIILTLFVAGASIAIDIITLLTSFLSGDEITTAFALKVLIVFLVAVAVFMHFIADLKGYWDRYRARERYVCTAVGILAAVAVIAGFFIVGTPYEARQMRFDAQRVTDLQSIQGQVVNYWQSKETLPPTLAALSDSIGGYGVPVDPETSEAYEYSVVGARSFELCAMFARPGESPAYARPVSVKGTVDTWAHAAGRVCFTRTIDPQLYPPFSQTAR